MCLSFLTFPQIGVDKGSHGKKIDFSEQVLACHFIFGLILCIFLLVILKLLLE